MRGADRETDRTKTKEAVEAEEDRESRGQGSCLKEGQGRATG